MNAPIRPLLGLLLVAATAMAPALATSLEMAAPDVRHVGHATPGHIAEVVARPDARTVDRAARALALGQRDFETAAATWSWRRGDTRPAANTGGVVALGLIEAAERSSGTEAAEAARIWGEARIADIADWRAIYDPDVEALAALARLTGEARFAVAAKEAFDRRWAGAQGDEVVGRLLHLRRRRPELVGYDAALTVRAALSVGEVRFATEIADALLEVRDAWDRVPDVPGADVYGLSTTGRASVLAALAGVDAARAASGEAPRFTRVIEALMVWLVAAQHAEGGWSQRNTQTTAYAVRALASVDSPMAREAAERGARWLASTQLPDGHWASFNDGLPEPFVGDVVHEVTAEVTLALAAVGR